MEGPRALQEALPWLRQLLVAESAAGGQGELIAAAEAAGAEVLTVSDRVLATVATTVQPQGVVGVATLTPPRLEEALSARGDGRARLVVALCGVADPGNLGTIVRSADACGADAVVVSAGSVDPTNPKAVRASAGSLFHLPVVAGPSTDGLVAALRAAGLRTLAVSADGSETVQTVDLSEEVAVVLGGEAHGLPAAVRAACDAQVRVPMAGAAESLNLAAAAAMVLYEAARQRAAPARGSQ